MILRPWEEKDIPVIAEMEGRCFPHDAWSKEMLADVVGAPYQWQVLAEEGGQVCGYCCLIVVCEDAEVGNIAVDTPFRGKGIGKALMEAMHQRAKEKGATQSFLEVRVSNASAIALYKKFGYESYGIRARYYEDGEDAMVMKRAL